MNIRWGKNGLDWAHKETGNRAKGGARRWGIEKWEGEEGGRCGVVTADEPEGGYLQGNERKGGWEGGDTYRF